MKNILIILFATFITLFSTVTISDVKTFKNNGANTPIDKKNKPVNNEINIVTKEEYEWLKKELFDTKNLLRNLKNSTDKIDNKIEAKIEKKVASHIVTIYSALIRNSLMVLGTFITLLSLLAAIIGLPKLHDYIKNYIENTHNKCEAESEAKVNYKIYVHLSHAFYLFYRDFLTDPGNVRFRSGVTLAIWFAEGAIANVEKLPEGKEKDQRLKFALLHKAYHFASESLNIEQELIASNLEQKNAIALAKDLNSFIDENYNSNTEAWINCKDTIAWIYILLGNNTEKSEGKVLVEDLVKHEKAPQYITKEIIENYCRIKNLSRFEENPDLLPDFVETK